MKSLTKKKAQPTPQAKKVKQVAAESAPKIQAQCCAKISRTVAGCHD